MTTNEELIERARELTAHKCVDAPEQECGQHGDEYSRLMNDLADALDGAATVQKMYDRACADIQEYSAAIERVRALFPEATDPCPPRSCTHVDCEVINALDGAPEPEWEWEWGVQYVPPSVYAGEPVSCASERAARMAVRVSSEPIRLHRRRPKVVIPADPYGGFDHESLRGAYTQMTNWLRGRAEMLRGGTQ